jgi:ACS family tartrate transporter-like MFS transporter
MTLEQTVFARVRIRLIPFMFVLYLVNYLDRVNIGFAALQMNKDLGFGPEAYGYGAGIFFWGYLLFEIPSNLLMERVGARKWIARIMISWGIVSTAMMFMRDATTFYTLRFLLGIAEAGFFPGMILYLTYWFPASERAKAVAQFMTANAIAGVIGGPISGALLLMGGLYGLRGWQWLFLLEGVPSILLGVVVLVYLTDRPEQAYWLTDEQRSWLVARMQQDRAERQRAAGGTDHHASLMAALTNPIVWLFALLYFSIVVCFYGVTFFLPSILKQLSGFSDFQTGLIAAIPYVVAAVSMVLVGMSSDRTHERHLHVAAASIVGAIGLVLSSMATNPYMALVTLSITAAGIWGTLGPFWAMPTAYLSGTAAAGGIALINSIGNLGGFLGPSVVGAIVQRTGGNYSLALATIASSLVIACVVVLALKLITPAPATPARAA